MKEKLYRRNALVILLFFPIAALLLYGKDISKKEFHQFGRIIHNSDSKLTFSTNLMALKRHGNMGLGFNYDKNQFMFAVNGKFYFLNQAGETQPVTSMNSVSFAYVTQFKQGLSHHFNEYFNFEEFNLYVLAHLDNSSVSAFQLSAEFSEIRLMKIDTQDFNHLDNSSDKGVKYRNLEGMVIGFVFPSSIPFVLDTSFIWIFISDDFQTVGRVLNFTAINGQLFFDAKNKVIIHL